MARRTITTFTPYAAQRIIEHLKATEKLSVPYPPRGTVVTDDGGDVSRLAKLTAYLVWGTGVNQWLYSGLEVSVRLATGWAEVESGYTWDATGSAGPPILNTFEAFNDGVGLEGNGIVLEDLPDGFELKPLRGEPVVRVFPFVDADGVLVWLTGHGNAIHGVCPPGG